MLPFKSEQVGTKFHLWIPDLSGCHTHCRTVSEAIENLKDAMNLYKETELEEEKIRR